MTVDGSWHVSSVLKGDGTLHQREYVHYVQRYVLPQEGRRYTGDVATRTWNNIEEAQKAADNANQGLYDFNIRGTYL